MIEIGKKLPSAPLFKLGEKGIDELEMPIELPKLGKNSQPIPLSQNSDFINASDNIIRESDTFDTFMDSSCLLYTSPSPRDRTRSRMPSSA